MSGACEEKATDWIIDLVHVDSFETVLRNIDTHIWLFPEEIRDDLGSI